MDIYRDTIDGDLYVEVRRNLFIAIEDYTGCGAYESHGWSTLKPLGITLEQYLEEND